MEEPGFKLDITGTKLRGEDWHFEDHWQAVREAEFANGRLTDSSILGTHYRDATGAPHAAARHGLSLAAP